MSNCFILLAAGKGKRFKSNNPKQFINYINKPLFMHSVDKAIKSKLFKSIIIVSNIPIKKNKVKSIKVIKGGKERYQSSQKALNFIKNKRFKNVFIHDAARPNFSIKLLKKLNSNLRTNKAVVPYVTTDNSAKYKIEKTIQNIQGIAYYWATLSAEKKQILQKHKEGEEWLGGFFCPCHGSKFDLAGRVYKGVPAPINLEVPPHSFDGDTLIIGEPA